MTSNQPEPWTYVSRKSRKGRVQIQKHDDDAASAAVAATRGEMSSQHRLVPFLTTAEIQADHERIKSQWTESPCRRRLKEILTSKIPDVPISKAVCLGIGSFDPANGAVGFQRIAHVQLAAFLDMVAHLQSRSGKTIPCTFQEPQFTAADKEFIQGLGHEVVNTPEGFEKVDCNSLVFGVHLYQPHYAAIIEKEIPGIFVGTDFDTWEERRKPGTEVWKSMQELDKACDKIAFPEDEDLTTFLHTFIHWKRPVETGKDEEAA